MKVEIISHGDVSLMDELRTLGYSIYSPCGGRGTCGKCRLRVIAGQVPVTPSDRRIFTQAELDDGYRLACRAKVNGNVTVEFDENILAGTPAAGKEDAGADYLPENWYAAVDIGTTTIVIALMDGEGRTLGECSFLNPLGAYGADVLSRMEAQVKGNGDRMSRELRGAVSGQLRELVEESMQGLEAEERQAGGKIECVSSIIIACNSTMTYLLMNMDCRQMMTYPFACGCRDFISMDASELFGNDFAGCEAVIFPSVSAFIGGDIVAGLYGLEFNRASEGSLLIDMGTNAEMVLKTSEGMLATSAAAGPALEGGHLSCGTGYVDGAVTHVSIEGAGARLTLAGGKDSSLRGLCGSGALELISELLRHGIIDASGRLTEEYAEEGYVLGADGDGRRLALTQSDIRELQLAKSAVYSSASLLISMAGEMKDSLHIYIAGAFGNGLDINKIRRVGIIPEADEVTAAGNTVLLGLSRYIRKSLEEGPDVVRSEIMEMLGDVKVVEQTKEAAFGNNYINNLNF